MADRPARGRAASEEALITAAADLFAEVGPNAVSVRNIADHAGVNHGLVHHYFGSKAGLVRAVLERVAVESEMAVKEEGLAAMLDPEDDRVRRHARIVARVVLDNAAPPGYQDAFPVMAHYREVITQVTGIDGRDARLRAAHGSALALGWLLLEPYLLVAAELADEDAGEVRSELQLAMRRLTMGDG